MTPNACAQHWRLFSLPFDRTGSRHLWVLCTSACIFGVLVPSMATVFCDCVCVIHVQTVPGLLMG